MRYKALISRTARLPACNLIPPHRTVLPPLSHVALVSKNLKMWGWFRRRRDELKTGIQTAEVNSLHCREFHSKGWDLQRRETERGSSLWSVCWPLTKHENKIIRFLQLSEAQKMYCDRDDCYVTWQQNVYTVRSATNTCQFNVQQQA
jgi:hypothetical protein